MDLRSLSGCGSRAGKATPRGGAVQLPEWDGTLTCTHGPEPSSCNSSRTSFLPGEGTMTRDPQRMDPSNVLSSCLFVA